MIKKINKVYNAVFVRKIDWLGFTYKSVNLIEELEEKTGVKIPRTTFGDQINGKTAGISNQKYIDALYTFTGLESIKKAYIQPASLMLKATQNSIEQGKLNLTQLLSELHKLDELARNLDGSGYEPSAEERAKMLSNSVNTSIDQVVLLSQYYRENPDKVEALTKTITKSLKKEDVGYLISALNAMFDNDRFKSWILMADYRPRRRK